MMCVVRRKRVMWCAEIMAFSGPGPEIINGRLAMLGVVAAIAAEAVSGAALPPPLCNFLPCNPVCNFLSDLVFNPLSAYF